MAADPPTLEYAKRPRFGWVSRHRHFLIFFALLIAIAGSVWWYWAPVKRWVMWHYWFRQAMAFQMPQQPGRVGVEDPTQAAQLLRTNPDYLKDSGFGFFMRSRPGSFIALYTPQVYRELFKLDPRIAMNGADATGVGPVAFMGIRHRPDGVPRLVIITGASAPDENFTDSIGVIVLPQPGWFDRLPPKAPVGMRRLFSGFIKYSIVVLQTGTAHPTDPTCITLPYVLLDAARQNIGPMVQSGQGEMKAYLQNDDSLLLKYSNRISGPTTLPGSVAGIQADMARRAGTAKGYVAGPTTAGFIAVQNRVKNATSSRTGSTSSGSNSTSGPNKRVGSQ